MSQTIQNHLTTIAQTAAQIQTTKETEFSKLLTGAPFWIKDKKLHAELYDKCTWKGHKGFCCFCHILGMPVKPGIGRLPWFDYQLDFLDLHDVYDYLRVIKSTGLGFSELELYYIGFKAFRRYLVKKAAQIPILTGPRIELAMGLIDRLENILLGRFPAEMAELFKKTATRIQIANTRIEAYPSHHIDTVRSLTNVIYALLDECDFFQYDPDDHNGPLPIIERYIGKSNPKIILVSTPNEPGGLFETMDRDPNSMYHTVRLNYEVGLNKIYTTEFIEKQKKSSSFEREYNLKYAYGIGNIFNESWIALALLKGERLRHIPVSYGTKKVMGLDPGYANAKFGAVKVEHLKYTQGDQYNNTKRVYFAKGFDRELYENMLDWSYNEIKKDRIDYVFIDGSQVNFIQSLKIKLGEDQDYEPLVERAKKFGSPLSDYMTVIPIYNQTHGTRMVEDAKYWMGISKTVAIDEQNCGDLVGQTRIAKQTEKGILDKKDTSSTYDVLEAWMYAMQFFVHT